MDLSSRLMDSDLIPVSMHIMYDVLNLSLITLHFIAVPSAVVMLNGVKMSGLVTMLHLHRTLITVSCAKAAEYIILEELEQFVQRLRMFFFV